MTAIDLDTYSLSLLTAKEDIQNLRSSTNWALFTYDGTTNKLKLSDSGAGGVAELAGKLHSSRPLYGFCRVEAPGSGQPRLVMIIWVGEGVEEPRKTVCAGHVPAIKNFFKEAHVFIDAHSPAEVTVENINNVVSKIAPPAERLRRQAHVADAKETVGTNYRKTNAAMEMRRVNRESFWARSEREEEERKEEERRRVLEERRQWERERVLQERKEAEERERKLSEKESLLEEKRRLQAKLETEAWKREKSKWEEQQREHEEEMRARFRRSESIEMAAEAAVLVSQRSMNPREFFRQLSSSSRTPTSPGSPHSGKPFRRYQRSLTDTAFIFNKCDSPTSPRSPTPTSPLFHPSSPFRAHPLRHTSSPSPSSPGRADPTFSPIRSSPQALSPPYSQPPALPNSPCALHTSPHRCEDSPSSAPSPPTGGAVSVPSAAAAVQNSPSRRNGADITELDTTSKGVTNCRGEEEFKVETIYKAEITSKEQAERPAEVDPETRPSPVHSHPVLTTETDLGVETELKPRRDTGVENTPSETVELEPEPPTSSETAAGTETHLVLETQREAVQRMENGLNWGCEAPADCEAASIESETESKTGLPFTPAEEVLRSEEKETHPAEQREWEAVTAGIVGTVSPLQLSSTGEELLRSKKETDPAEQRELEAVTTGIVGTVSPLQLSSAEEEVLRSKKETDPAEQRELEAVTAGIVGTVSPLQLSSTEEEVLRSEKETDPAEQREREAVTAGIVGTVSPLQLSSTEEEVLRSKEKETDPAEQREWEAVTAGIVGTVSPLQLSSTEEEVLRSEKKETDPAEQREWEAVTAGIVGTVSPLQLSSTEEEVLRSEKKETDPAEQREWEAVTAGIVGTVSPLQLSSTEEEVLRSEEKETDPAEQREQEAVTTGIVGTMSPLQLSSTEEEVLRSEEKETDPAEQREWEAVTAGIVGTVSPLQLSSTGKDGVIETEEDIQKELTTEMSLEEEGKGETEEEEGERESTVEHNGRAELNHQTEEHCPQNAPKQDSVSARCRAVHAGTEVDHTTKEQEERSEKHSKEPEREMCVRALYDYQAEDDSELSFEPGDIISAVEMVDQGWWRGCSEDGRQGLFPSSYVETL
ncbi:drebrin-like isoform X2 [Polyodon spathula]|uniref:drebrin-like isoform X2 n=1 Tax=Polyodon spathula TaxID=7913 RepID=UPI001B7F457E|nr:drebrin-like isoform X2 [Polyodon spathula]